MVDRTSGVPAYRQVADAIRGQIESGELAPGALLPSERELVTRFDVSRPTIRDAIKRLRSQGLVVAEHGRGVFVRSQTMVIRLARDRLSRSARAEGKGAFLSDAAAGHFHPSVSVRIRFEPADGNTARSLRIKEGAEVLVRDRVMRADGHTVQLSVSRLSREITRGTPIEREDTGDGGLYARLEETGHKLDHFDTVLGARMPTPDEQSKLQLRDGTPVITVTRVAHTADRPVELNDMVLAADTYELHYQLPAD